MKQKLKSLRSKLPARGYTSTIMEADKNLQGKGAKQRFTYDDIKNFFTGRAVTDAKKVLIINATKAAIEAENKKKQTLKKLLQTV